MKIRKGVNVRVNFAGRSAPAVGTISHIEPSTLVVSLVAIDGHEGSGGPSGEGEGVRITAVGDDALYRFRSLLLRRSGMLLYLSPPEEVERIQRRQDVREACLLQVELVTPGDRAIGQRSHGTAVNISCGGLLIVHEGRLDLRDVLEIIIYFPTGGAPVETVGTVVRTEPLSRGGRILSRDAAILDGLSKGHERRIREFITRVQLKVATGRQRGA